MGLSPDSFPLDGGLFLSPQNTQIGQRRSIHEIPINSNLPPNFETFSSQNPSLKFFKNSQNSQNSQNFVPKIPVPLNSPQNFQDFPQLSQNIPENSRIFPNFLPQIPVPPQNFPERSFPIETLLKSDFQINNKNNNNQKSNLEATSNGLFLTKSSQNGNKKLIVETITVPRGHFTSRNKVRNGNSFRNNGNFGSNVGNSRNGNSFTNGNGNLRNGNTNFGSNNNRRNNDRRFSNRLGLVELNGNVQNFAQNVSKTYQLSICIYH